MKNECTKERCRLNKASLDILRFERDVISPRYRIAIFFIVMALVGAVSVERNIAERKLLECKEIPR